MKAKLLENAGGQTYALVFDKDEEVAAGLLDFATSYNLCAGHLTGIGGFSDVTLGFFDRERLKYRRIPVREQVEVLSLVGDIALAEGKPKIHAHVVVGKADGSAHGGHLLEAHAWPTLEVVIEQSPSTLRRRVDEETGLPLLAL